MKQTRTISAKDNVPIEVTTWFPPSFDSVVLIGPGLGIRRTFYHTYAFHLLEQNIAAVTFDYRGIGGSRSKPIEEVEADATTWAKQDLGGCIQWITNHYPEKNLTALCHSLSGQFLGMVPEAVRFDRIVTIVTGGGYWNFYPFPKNLAFWFIWYGLFPVTSTTLGYFPGDWLGLGEDLPQGVALEVARWGRSPNYIGNYSRYDDITAPIRAYSFEDDPYCPEYIVDYMHEQYTSADVSRRHIQLDETSSDQIGHFGFFRDGNVPELWDEVTSWLEGREPTRT